MCDKNTAANTTFVIPTLNMHKFEERMVALNRKAVRLLGEETISYKVLETLENHPVTVVYHFDGQLIQETRKMECVRVQVEGIVPQLDGWNFVARMDWDAGLPIITGLGEYPEHFHDAKCGCDHCGKTRARRNTYIVEKNNEYKQIGGQCLKLYLGGKTPQAIAGYYEFVRSTMQDFEDFGEVRASSPTDMLASLKEVIAATLMVTDITGYISADNATDTNRATKDELYVHYLNQNSTFSDMIRSQYCGGGYTEFHKRAEEIIAHVDGLKKDNNFLRNCEALIKANTVKQNQLGIACAFVAIWLRHEANKKDNADKANSQHVGKVGERLKKINVTVESHIHRDSMYGWKTIITFIYEGNVMTAFHNGYLDLENGTEYTISTTVKEHGEFKGYNQTIVNRTKFH